jgi:hypothetical protein
MNGSGSVIEAGAEYRPSSSSAVSDAAHFTWVDNTEAARESRESDFTASRELRESGHTASRESHASGHTIL